MSRRDRRHLDPDRGPLRRSVAMAALKALLALAIVTAAVALAILLGGTESPEAEPSPAASRVTAGVR